MTQIKRIPPRPFGHKPAWPTRLIGTVRTAVVGKGSKSERRTLVVEYQGRKVVVERKGGNTFQLDATERALIGKRVLLEGNFVSPSTFRFTGSKKVKDERPRT